MARGRKKMNVESRTPIITNPHGEKRNLRSHSISVPKQSLASIDQLLDYRLHPSLVEELRRPGKLRLQTNLLFHLERLCLCWVNVSRLKTKGNPAEVRLTLSGGDQVQTRRESRRSSSTYKGAAKMRIDYLVCFSKYCSSRRRSSIRRLDESTCG